MTGRRAPTRWSAWRAIATAVARWRQQARQRAELCSLDDRTLRDLGLDRSELPSILAESTGAAEATRCRTAPWPPEALAA